MLTKERIYPLSPMYVNVCLKDTTFFSFCNFPSLSFPFGIFLLFLFLCVRTVEIVDEHLCPTNEVRFSHFLHHPILKHNRNNSIIKIQVRGRHPTLTGITDWLYIHHCDYFRLRRTYTSLYLVHRVSNRLLWHRFVFDIQLFQRTLQLLKNVKFKTFYIVFLL